MKVSVKRILTLELDDNEADIAVTALFYGADAAGMDQREGVTARTIAAALADPDAFMRNQSDQVIRVLRDRFCK